MRQLTLLLILLLTCITTTCFSAEEFREEVNPHTGQIDLLRSDDPTFDNVTITGSLTGSGAYWQASGNDIFNSNSGNVGIGTTIPGMLLHIDSGSSSTTGQLGVSLNSNNRFIKIGVNGTADPDVAKIAWDDNDSLAIGTDSLFSGLLGATFDELVRIKSNGNVGIGTTSPTSKLHVSGPISISSTRVTDASYEALTTDADIQMDSDAADQIVYLTGTGVARANVIIDIANVGSSGNTVTVYDATNGINGQTIQYLNDYDSVRLKYDSVDTMWRAK